MLRYRKSDMKIKNKLKSKFNKLVAERTTVLWPGKHTSYERLEGIILF